MKTVLILGGQSKRFWPLTDKSLFPLCGKTVIEHQVAHLRHAGCADILLVASPQNHAEVKTLFPDLTVLKQTRPANGMREAFLDALPHCGDEQVLLTHGNDIVDPSAYRTAVERFAKGDCDGVLLARRMTHYFPGGYVTTKGERITGIVEKPGEGREPSDLVNIVVHAHRNARELLTALTAETGETDDGYERALAKLFANKRYVAVPYEGPWQAVKYPWHLLPALDLLLSDITESSIHETAQIHPSAVIDGPVIIGEGARILAHAAIQGPTYIGAHTVVGNSTLVRGSSIADHCVVGFGTEAARSAWHEGVWTHMSYTGDSIIGRNVSLGAGCITGNLRLDEREIASLIGEQRVNTRLTKFGAAIGDDCRIGIRVAINPGCKIGAGCFVGGGCMIDRDIPEKTFVKLTTSQLDIRENSAAPAAPRKQVH